ncbi:MAG: hypothetical protein ACLFPS_03220 [Clostridia bacterium]
MNQKNNALIGIFIMILLTISIIMPIIFFNSHEVEALDINNPNLYFEIKGAKNVSEYVPKTKAPEINNSNIDEIEEDDLEIIDKNENDNELIDNLDEVDNIEVLLEQYKDDIESEDLDQGIALMEKVDLDYLLSFDRENLTPEQKEEIKNYLRSKLTESEYNKVVELIGKYIGLIE